MREMKDSGNQFIGLIPEHWIVTRLKQLLVEGSDGIKIGPYGSALKGKTQPQGPFKIYNQANVISGNFGLCRHFISEENYNALSSYSVKAGDVLFSMMGTIGKCRIMPDNQIPGIMDSHLLKARLDNKKLLSDLFCYIYDKDNNPSSFAQMLFETQGSIMNGLNSEIVKNLWLTYPPDMKEQQEIVKYLDSKCSQIDEAIRRQESTIEKLKEYRQSVITEAVTKGLNQNAEMKDSGNQFIGLIPKHWIVVRLKHLLVEGYDGIKIGPYGSALKGKTQPQGPFKIYNQANVISGDFGLCRHFISAENYKVLSGYTVKAGDVLFSMMGTIGKCRIMPENQTPGIMDSHLLKARLDNKKLLPNLFCYIYDKDNNPSSFAQMLFETQGSIMNGLNSEIVKNLWLAYPSDLKEQQEITKYLDSKCSQIDEAIRRQESIIEKLKSYRRSLVYEVVTGKKEVV